MTTQGMASQDAETREAQRVEPAIGEELQLGISRPPLKVDDLPQPEEVFDTPHIGTKELITLVLGPSMIALGASIGSGEWLIGPLTIGTQGFMGVGWVILVSAVLQVFYNIEAGRFTLATGETPLVAFGRTPPGFRFWIPLTVLVVYFAFVWGGWAAGAGQALFALITGRLNTPEELGIVRLMGIGLLVVVFVITLFGKKVARTLELVTTVMVSAVLVSVLLLALFIVPGSVWAEGFGSLFIPARPPAGSDPSLLGALAGFTAFASGINFLLINYYRDKGYGMGHRVGYISGVFGGKREEVLPSGVTFRESEENTRRWHRWFRFLLLDQWVVFFIGAILGIMLPSLLVSYLAGLPGADAPSTANMPVYAALQLQKQGYNPLIFYWTLLISFLILFSTQMVIFEILVRNFTEAVNAISPRVREWTEGDPRRFYYPFQIALVIVIAVLLNLDLPTGLLVFSANMANLGALIFPFVLIYLNTKLPRPARMAWWSYVVLLFNVVFFGFFFLNFLSQRLLGNPLVSF